MTIAIALFACGRFALESVQDACMKFAWRQLVDIGAQRMPPKRHHPVKPPQHVAT
jgi:hypothetical protein